MPTLLSLRLRAAVFTTAIAAVTLASPHPVDAVTGGAAEHELRLGVTFTPRATTALNRSEIVGELDLHVLPGGQISGFYRPESDRSEIRLTGAITKTGTFLDIGGGFRHFHVDGFLVDASATGSSLAGTARIDDQIYDVEATSCQTDRGDLSILCQ